MTKPTKEEVLNDVNFVYRASEQALLPKKQHMMVQEAVLRIQAFITDVKDSDAPKGP